MSTTERLIADFACVSNPFYVDGIFAKGVVNPGANFSTPYCRYVPTGRHENVGWSWRGPQPY
jgi:hypothetical protein